MQEKHSTPKPRQGNRGYIGYRFPLTPASINRESSFISVWKACARWYVVRSIAFSFNSIELLANKKKTKTGMSDETMPAREINPFTALTRIRSQFLRTQWSTSNHQRVGHDYASDRSVVILCDKEVAILRGPTLTMNLKVTMGRHRLL